MTSSAEKLRRLAAFAGLLALAVTPTVSGGERSVLQVQSVRLDDDRLAISVFNPGDRTAHGKLVLRYALESGVVETQVRVVVAGGETTLIELGSPAPGQEMTPVGVILDDGSPF